MGAYKIIEGKEGGEQPAVIPAGAEQFHQLQKGLLPPAVELLHHLAGSLLAQHLQLLFVRHPDVGGQAQGLEIGAD